MDRTNNKRRLRNVNLTSKHHFSHLGLWILIMTLFIVTVNADVYWYAKQYWEAVYSVDDSLEKYHVFRSLQLMGIMIIKTTVFVLGAVLLAKFTSHRVYGPFINLVNTCDAIRDGDVDRQLKFRDYDNLEYVESSFNGMVNTLREGQRGGSAVQTSDEETQSVKMELAHSE